MTARDVRCRFTGAVLLVAAIGTGFATYHMPSGALRGFGEAGSLALALAGFSLACLGALFLFRGARMRDKWLDACDHVRGDNVAGAEETRNGTASGPPMDPFLLNAAFGGCGRMAITTHLMLRAQQQRASAPQKPHPCSRPHCLAATGALQFQREKL